MQEEKIIAAVKNQEEWAIDFLMTKYSKLLWSIVYPILHNIAAEEDMEECVADVFIYIWQKPQKIDLERGKLKNYLALLARSRAIERYREKSRLAECELAESLLHDEADLLEGVIQKETLARLTQLLAEIDEREREILLRRHYYEQKPKEIAKALELPVKKIENILYRSKARLRESFISREGEMR